MNLQERIRELARKKLSNCFEMGLRQSPTDAENSEFYRPLIDLTIAPELTKEITTLIEKDYVEKNKLKRKMKKLFPRYIPTCDVFPEQVDEYIDNIIN